MFRQPDISLLADLRNREANFLAYAMESLLWLNAQSRADWAASITEPFWVAVQSVLAFFVSNEMALGRAAQDVRQALASWRNDVVDAPAHPYSQLGRVIAGDMGQHLELLAPVVPLTCNEVLEGIANEEVLNEWPQSERAFATQLATCAVVLATVAEACFWSAGAGEGSLTRELRRAFSDGGRQLRQQLSLLSVAARGRAWGLGVDLVNEGANQTPDLQVSERGETLYVECTSRSTRAPTLNDSTALARAIATAWSEKRAKFVDERYRPGLVTLELSGQPIDRGFGQLLIQALVRTLDLDIPGGAKREISLYSSKDDTEFMASESIRRGLIGVLASCLWSREALERDIRGIALHYDQEFWVDTRAGGSIRRPQRGLLVWRGGIDASLMLAVRLSEPAIPTSTLTPSVHLV